MRLTLLHAHCIGTISQLACCASNCPLLNTRAGLPLQSPADIGSVRRIVGESKSKM